MFSRRSIISSCAAIILAFASLTPAASADEAKLTIFAAASLKTALDKVSEVWAAETKKDTSISYAASSALAKQIESGAPADIFISADTQWMSYLMDRKLIATDSVINLLGNEIVLIAPADSKIESKLDKGVDLAALVGDGKLAMADVKAVPAGRYGKAALESLGAWTGVEAKVAQAENVRAALKLVSTREATLGIVYVTDAHADTSVKVIATFPASSHPPIVYPTGVVTGSKNPDAMTFVTFLRSPKAIALFKAEGFTVLTP
jgi:molybdate transport system substrate-binding protein